MHAHELSLQVKESVETPPRTYSYAGWYRSLYIHHVRLTNLTASTRYAYACFSNDDGGDSYGFRSLTYYFTTAPLLLSEIKYSVAIIGDLGQTEFSMATARAIAIDPTFPLMIAHVGDISCTFISLYYNNNFRIAFS
jgi:hypothetical protein